MLTRVHRAEDDAALRAKVDEALTVYDEYVRTKATDGSAPPGDNSEKAEEPKTGGGGGEGAADANAE